MFTLFQLLMLRRVKATLLLRVKATNQRRSDYASLLTMNPTTRIIYNAVGRVVKLQL